MTRPRVSGGYDHVVVGAGSAGCVLAARLSEDPARSVLLIEAGGWDRDPLISIPLGVGLLWSERFHDWGYDSVPQAALNGRSIELARGKIVGGSSSINAMSHVWGRPGDFDRWERLGCSGWGFDDVVDDFRRSESWAGEATSGDLRGKDGPIGVRLAASRDPLFDAWLEAARSAGYPVLPDYNLGAAEGFGRCQFAIKGGCRASASRAYLRPALRRPNLTVLTGALAHRLVVEHGRVVGVEFSLGRDRQTVRADRGVVLSAGVFNTPKLLMQSGIGPADELQRHDIPVVADRGEVGRNLQDHPGVVVAYARKEPGPFQKELRLDRLTMSMARAYLFGSGPATALPSGLHGFVRLTEASDVPEIQFMFRGAPRDAAPWFPGLRPPVAEAYSIRPVLLHPRSRGNVRLTGASPEDPLAIDPNLLAEPEDLDGLRQGVRIARKIGEKAALQPFRAKERTPGPAAESDEDLNAFIRRSLATAHHPAGTCRMGSDANAVVDCALNVNGVEGLRIADASVMPDLVSGNINATVVMIAERCARLCASAG